MASLAYDQESRLSSDIHHIRMGLVRRVLGVEPAIYAAHGWRIPNEKDDPRSRFRCHAYGQRGECTELRPRDAATAPD